MKHLRILSLLLIAAALSPAQMTPSEKALDFSQMAATYAMNYGPLQWKRDALNFDLLNIGDWLAKAMNTKDDLDFYELCVSYVASLNDAHDVFLLPSDFQAYLGFDVDIYDGKTIIEYINRRQLPAGDFPFQVGDELVSLDGVSTQDLIQQFTRYSIAANPLSTSRFSASSITFRAQQIMPHAHLIPALSTAVINRQSGGVQSFSIPWLTVGTPLTIVGPVLPPFTAARVSASSTAHEYMQPLNRLQNLRIPDRKLVLGLGELKPVFTLPANFVLRMGSSIFDSFYTGTYQAQGLTIGYIRIPAFDGFFASDDFQKEIDYMQKNTNGLIVDIMRNPGGSACLAQDLLSRIMPNQFQTIGFEIRATRQWVADFQQALQDARAAGAPATIVRQYEKLLQQVTAAFLMPSGRTPPLPICGTSLDVVSAMDTNGQVIAYNKPVMLLADEISASAAEFFAAVFQDNQRGPIFGMRTMGAGGNVQQFPVSTYSEGQATLTESLMHRKNPVSTPEYPTAFYVENIGVRPEIKQDYMTVDNLLNHGSTFVQAFTDAMVKVINGVSTTQIDSYQQQPFMR